MSFEPKIPGKFKWTSASTLIFSPEVQLEPIQIYKAKVSDKVIYDKPYSSDFEVIEFQTPDFDVTKVEFFWTNIPNQYYTTSIQANVVFNYPISPDQLKKYIEIKKGNEILDNFEVISKSKTEIVAINLGEIQQTNQEQEIGRAHV